MFAPGIFDKTNKPELPTFQNSQMFEFVVQEHLANKAGRHLDLRLGDPKTGQGYSWAGRYWPANGDKVLMVYQPVHDLDYFDFAGKIESGYGAGTVNIVKRGKAEIIHSEPGKITFYTYENAGSPSKYTLIRTSGDQWVFLNHTLSAQPKKFLELPALKYKDGKSKDLLNMELITPKIDGATSLTILRPGKTPIVYGRRESKKTGLPIEYTAKIPGLLNQKPPKSLGTTVLRTEVFAYKNNQELPNRQLSGLLNSHVEKSRQSQREMNTPLRLAAFDVIKYRGKDVSNLPISEKYRIINQISSEYPIIQNPLNLQKFINFPEGSIGWKNGQPYKFKNIQDHDVYVRDVFDSTNVSRAGGVSYSLTPDGPIVGNVGSGWTHSELKDMLKNKQKYIGRVAKITALEQHPSGAFRAPSFLNWHLDKNDYDN